LADNDNGGGERGPPRIGALDTLGAVRTEAGRLYRRALRGEIDTLDASRLASVLALVGRLVEGSELEARMDALERRLSALVPRRCA
jgi:hypothetical protein